MTDPIVYLNGEMTPLSEARVPVLDRGFIFGDGIYDVVPVYGKKGFRAQEHVSRLFRSMEMIGIPNPHTREQWFALIDQVIDANGLEDQLVYIQVTRGVAKRAHAFPKEVVPTVFIMTNPLVLPSEAVRTAGVACVTIEDKRWLNCQVKATSLLGNILAAQHAAEEGVLETIQFRDGYLTEGSSSNIWVVRNGKLLAPPKDNLILEGIRYGLLEELSAAKGIPFEARKISKEEVLSADEVMVSSASKELLPVVKIDGQPVGTGQPGSVFKTLYAAYQDAKAAL
jgi:D-alanine transaminase